MSEHDAWKEAVIAWSVCASIHREYAKRRDPLYTTRQADFLKHESDSRAALDAAYTAAAARLRNPSEAIVKAVHRELYRRLGNVLETDARAALLAAAEVLEGK